MTARPYSGMSASSPESLAFFQRRVGQFGLVAGSLGAALLVYRLLLELLLGDSGQLAAEFGRRSFAYHCLAIACFATVWLVSLGPPRSRRLLEATEILGFVGSSACYMGMGEGIPLTARPELLVMFVMSFGLIARAAWVPSTARRTAVIGLLTGVPLVVLTWVAYSSVDAELLRKALQPFDLDRVTSEQSVWMATGAVSMWWGLAVALAASISQVIFGLRREVRRARRLGQYELEEKLGEGGMGVVYKAHHAMLARPTAVKLLPAARSSENDVARFEREVRQTARLTHPNTITVFDYGRTPDGVFYYAMELLDGADLERIVLATGPLPPERVIHVLSGVAGALSEAHDAGMVHRDLKPSNVMLCTRGGRPDTPKVLDFGLVKQLAEEEEVGLTREGAVAGTPYYMSPEAIRSSVPVDARSDLYAVGAIGYFLLTGEPVFHGARVVEIYAAHLHTPPVAPSRRAGRPIPKDLEGLILDCLAKDPAARPQTAAQLLDRLAACNDADGWSVERAREWWARHEGPLRSSTPRNDLPRTAWDGLATVSRADA